jgi:L-ribulose-5-phosphate 3-epimerase
MATLSLGTIISRGDPERFGYLKQLGLTSCQLSSGGREVDEKQAARVREAAAAAGVTISSILAGWSGPAAWNFVDGPSTIGLVPPQHRATRLAELKRSADFAALLGVPNIVSHIGFLPVDPKDADYLGAVEALAELADHCGERGVWFCFETGQETPVVLRRCMEDIGRSNLGINLDPANLLMYGNANPVDALDLLGPYIRDVHAKDGDYPTEGRSLGPERVLGEGRVNFPALIPKLKSFGYAGSLTIEREISGPRQTEDIKHAIALLQPLL